MICLQIIPVNNVPIKPSILGKKQYCRKFIFQAHNLVPKGDSTSRVQYSMCSPKLELCLNPQNQADKNLSSSGEELNKRYIASVLILFGQPHRKTNNLHRRKQRQSNCKADQHLCFRYTDSTISLLSKSKISNL